MRFINALSEKLFSKKYKRSYSQSGEDLIIQYLFSIFGIEDIFYVDIGTHHPYTNNNTYLFYTEGNSGICIEPNPDLFKKIKKERKHDTVLNVGTGAKTDMQSNYYRMTASTLNTFSKSEAERYASNTGYGQQKIEEVLRVPIISINEILKKHAHKKINLLSLDIEGLDFELLQSLDFDTYNPDILCIETSRCVDNRRIEQDKDMINFILTKGYHLYADTSLNSIFINKKIWNTRYE